MSASSKRILLIHPPYGDFTYPYHSLSYVSAPLKAAGYEVDAVDLNALWFRSIFNRGTVDRWRREWETELRELDQRRRLKPAQQERLVELLRSLAIAERLDPERAVETLRSEAFYDPDAYLAARDQVRSFEKLLSQLYGPYDFFGSFALPAYEPCSRSLVDKALASRRLIDDLAALLRQRYGGAQYLFCGVSFPFSVQLTPGFAALQAVREVFPGAVRVAGGTAISDVYKYKESVEALAPFHPVCDYFYVAEAETAILEFTAFCAGEVSAPPPQVVDLAAPGARPARMPVPYIALATAEHKRFQPYAWDQSPPDYGWVEWDLYLSPERRINYSPSRGCFWNQCTFCDYGLNGDSPTAPSRTMEVETVMAHFRGLAEQGVRHVYLAVDAIAPKFIAAFAEGLLAAGIDLHWSCQFFLTKTFTPELVGKLEDAGLRLASFGLESGSNRVLELMGKGKNRVDEVLRPVLEVFRGSRIGLQPLFFFGFPGETDADRQATVDFLTANADVFSTITKGGLFALLPGAMVARNPEAFGVQDIRRVEGDNIAGSLEYRMSNDAPVPACDAYREFNDQLPYVSLYERPWLGGIDTFHAQLYVERYGRDIFHRLRDRFADWQPAWNEISVHSRYDLDEILEKVVIRQAMTLPGAQESLRAQLPGLTPGDVEALVGEAERQPRRRFTLRFRPYAEPSDGNEKQRLAASPRDPGAAAAGVPGVAHLPAAFAAVEAR